MTRQTIPPVVGMAATFGIGPDRYPYVITAVSASGKTVQARGQWWHAERPDEKFTLRTDGVYRPVGANYGYLYIGAADDYQSPDV